MGPEATEAVPTEFTEPLEWEDEENTEIIERAQLDARRQLKKTISDLSELRERVKK